MDTTRSLRQRYEAAHRFGMAVVRGDDQEYQRALHEVRRFEFAPSPRLSPLPEGATRR